MCLIAARRSLPIRVLRFFIFGRSQIELCCGRILLCIEQKTIGAKLLWNAGWPLDLIYCISSDKLLNKGTTRSTRNKDVVLTSSLSLYVRTIHFVYLPHNSGNSCILTQEKLICICIKATMYPQVIYMIMRSVVQN